MMRRSVLVSLALLASACTTSEHKAPLGGSTQSSGASDPAPAATNVSAKDLCAQPAVVRDGPTVKEMSVAEAAPAPVGGNIAPGKYWLTRIDDFTGPNGSTGATGDVAAVTLVVGDGTFRIAEAEGTALLGLYDEELKARTFRTDGTQLVTTTACVSKPVVSQRGYSVVGDELHVFTSPTRREVFKRQP